MLQVKGILVAAWLMQGLLPPACMLPFTQRFAMIFAGDAAAAASSAAAADDGGAAAAAAAAAGDL